MKRLSLTLILLLVSCGTHLPPKDRAILSIDFVDKRLTTLQDTELRICNEAQYNKIVAAGTPIATSWPPTTPCAGPLSDATKLTTDKHKEFSAKIADAFAIQKKAAILIKAWTAGQPAPPELNALLSQAQAVVAIIGTLAVSDGQRDLLSLGNTTIAEIQKIIDTIRGGETHAAGPQEDRAARARLQLPYPYPHWARV